jgi:cellobiose epimerase
VHLTYRSTAALVAALLMSVQPGAQPPQPEARLRALAPAVERNLKEAVIGFWFPRSIDAAHGGYIINYGPKGEALAGGTKMIVTQARQLWLSSRLLRTPYATAALRDAADHGFRFLRDAMWDRVHGGFLWELDADGRTVRRPHKHLYGQAFAIYALAEYALATGNREALNLAMRTFRLVDDKAHDAAHGGYREYFRQDWSAPPAGEAGYLGAPADLKLMNTHLHLLEAFTTLLRATSSPLVRERLLELVAIETHAVVRVGWVASTDRHHPDWTPLLDASAARVSYGHDLENIWLVAEALDVLNQPVAPYTQLFRAIFSYSRQYGFDETHGGFFDSGPRGQPADRRHKVWWTQAEALVSALTMYQLTKDAHYVDVFEKTWRFIDATQTDYVNGEWWDTIEPDGRPRQSNKAQAWKAGYHNGRALIEVLARLGHGEGGRSPGAR